MIYIVDYGVVTCGKLFPDPLFWLRSPCQHLQIEEIFQQISYLVEERFLGALFGRMVVMLGLSQNLQLYIVTRLNFARIRVQIVIKLLVH